MLHKLLKRNFFRITDHGSLAYKHFIETDYILLWNSSGIAKDGVAVRYPATFITIVFYFLELGSTDMPGVVGQNPTVVTDVSLFGFDRSTQVSLGFRYPATSLTGI